MSSCRIIVQCLTVSLTTRHFSIIVMQSNDLSYLNTAAQKRSCVNSRECIYLRCRQVKGVVFFGTQQSHFEEGNNARMPKQFFNLLLLIIQDKWPIHALSLSTSAFLRVCTCTITLNQLEQVICHNKRFLKVY